MEILNFVVRLGLAVATTTLFGVVLLTYLRLRSHKMLFITIGFGTFFFNALILMLELFSQDIDVAVSQNLHLFMNFIGLILILFGILRE